MKILPNEEIIKAHTPDKTKDVQNTKGNDFKTILDKSIENADGVETGAQKTPHITKASGVQPNELFSAKNTAMIQRTERFLDILDQYQQKLRSPQATLRDVYPLIQQMGSEKESLIPALKSLPDGDELKDILNRALITSSVEIIKFNRGYYLNP